MALRWSGVYRASVDAADVPPPSDIASEAGMQQVARERAAAADKCKCACMEHGKNPGKSR